MRALLLTLLLISTNTFAGGLERLGVKNLSFDYAAPIGNGIVEKLDIGMSKALNETFVVERVGETFVARTSFLDFTWMAPWKFLFDVEKLNITAGNLNAGSKSHNLSAESAVVSLKGEYKALKIAGECTGTSEHPQIEKRLMDDCRDSLKLEIDRLEIPMDFFLADVLSRLPPMPDDEQPLKNFTLTSRDGDFYMYFLATYVFKAGLRTWGAFHYEDDFGTVVIRVDLIKFGYLSVTGLVMKELKERIKSPNVKIEPPFIRVRIRE